MNMPKLRVCVTCDRVTCPQQETPIPQRPTRGFRRNRTWTRGKNWVHATDLSRVLANTVFSVDRTRKAQPVPAAAGRGGPDCSTQVARRYQHSLAPHEPAKPLPTQDASRAAVSRLPGATADRTVRRAGRASVRGEGHKQDNAQDNTDGQQDEAHLVARAALAALSCPPASAVRSAARVMLDSMSSSIMPWSFTSTARSCAAAAPVFLYKVLYG